MRPSCCLILVAALGLVAGCSSVSVRGRADTSVVVGDDDHHHGRSHGRHEQAHPAHLGVPPGHLPPPGQCRVWRPGRPPGHQSPPGRCAALQRRVPAGAWLLYRPAHSRKFVEVTAYDARRTGTVLAVRLYDADTGAFLRVVGR